MLSHAKRAHKEKLSPADLAATFLVEQVAGRMWFFVICILLSLAPAVFPDWLPTVQFISSGVLQLDYLPLMLMYGFIQSRYADARSDQLYRMEEYQQREITAIKEELARQTTLLEAIYAART